MGENHDMENSDYDMHGDDHGEGKGEGKGEKDAADYGYGPMGMNGDRREGNQGIVINNNVGGGCEMDGIAERIAKKVVEMMMEGKKNMMDGHENMMDKEDMDKEDMKAEADKAAEEAKKEKKEKKEKKNNNKKEE